MIESLKMNNWARRNRGTSIRDYGVVFFESLNKLRIIKETGLLLIVFVLSLAGFSQTPAGAYSNDTPNNQPCKVIFDKNTGRLQLLYEGTVLLQAQLASNAAKLRLVQQVDTSAGNNALTQSLKFSTNEIHLKGVVNTSNEAIAAEYNNAWQQRFPIVRTTIGNSSKNLRNNSIYDRYSDWMIEFRARKGKIKIVPGNKKDKTKSFAIIGNDDSIEIVFRPLFYQKHKGLKYFTPRTYNVWQEPVTGWSSWWAYLRKFNEQDLQALLKVWNEKRLHDFGYKYIQIDDAYQGGLDAGHNAPAKGPNGYYATGPKTWLNWKKDLFPGGLNGYVKNVKDAGFIPGIWMGCFFTDSDTVTKHPDWFVKDSLGRPAVGPWVTYAIDATNKSAVSALIRPTFKGLKQAGVRYVKIDQLRHYLYDNMHNNLSYFSNGKSTPDSVFRSYLRTAREELGNQTYILSCWGVLPQAVGLVDACRMGGDGYGPVTMQQYNSWNGIVWINDPDHCDIYPAFKALDQGNVKEVQTITATTGETRLRPALASVAGAALILSDKPEVYKNDSLLEGVKRAAPVLFSVPGQLYDYDPVKSSRLVNLDDESIKKGAGNSPIDADQFGTVCPWWLNEINRNFEDWNVLSRLNWTKNTMPSAVVRFADLGLDAKKEYLVFEFWNKRFLGIVKDSFETPELAASDINTFAIRERENHPQVISTNRHLSQGGYDLVKVEWKNNTLAGVSKVVKGDLYQLYISALPGYEVRKSGIAEKQMSYTRQGQYYVFSYIPTATGKANWGIEFDKK